MQVSIAQLSSRTRFICTRCEGILEHKPTLCWLRPSKWAWGVALATFLFLYECSSHTTWSTVLVNLSSSHTQTPPESTQSASMALRQMELFPRGRGAGRLSSIPGHNCSPEGQQAGVCTQNMSNQPFPGPELLSFASPPLYYRWNWSTLHIIYIRDPTESAYSPFPRACRRQPMPCTTAPLFTTELTWKIFTGHLLCLILGEQVSLFHLDSHTEERHHLWAKCQSCNTQNS